MSDKTDALKTLYSNILDSRHGYRLVRDKMEAGDDQSFIDGIIQERDGFLETMRQALASEGIEAEEKGSMAASLHRGLFKIQDAISSDQKGLFKECARGDDHLKSAYDKAIDATDGEEDWHFLTTQRANVGITLEKLKARV